MGAELEAARARADSADATHQEMRAKYLSCQVDADTYLAARREYEAAYVAYHEAARRAQGERP